MNAEVELGVAGGVTADKKSPMLCKLTAEEAKARKCIIYNGAAFDVSSYASKHPGGEMMLTSRYGEDVTDDFDALGHSDHAKEVLKTLYVAEAIVDEEAGASRRNLWTVPLKLISSRQLTSSTWELTFEWEQLPEVLILAPGRHVKLTTKDTSQATACSRSYTPVDFNAAARTVILGIKFYDKGEMSQLLLRAVTMSVADQLTFEMTGPLGEIMYNEKDISSGETVYSSSENLVLIAGGSGITPFLAVLRSKKIESKKVTLVYCAKAQDDLMYEEEIRAQLPEEYQLRILCPALRETVAKEVIEAVNSCAAPGRDTTCVVCGPPPFEEAIHRALASENFTQVLTSTSSAGQKKKVRPQGGASSTPQVLVNGKRPFDLYPPASIVLRKTVSKILREPILPTAMALLLWPVYVLIATFFQSQGFGERTFFTGFSCILFAVTYMFFNSFYALIEHQRWFERHKIDREPHQLGSWEQVKATLRDAFVGRVVLAPFIMYIVMCWVLYLRGMLQMTFVFTRPTVSELYVSFLVASLVNTVGFYFAHRMLHSSFLYAKIHKQHHEWKGTVSYSAEYAHPAEQLLANYLPTFGGCLLLGVHPWIFCIWVCERLRETYEAHSGYAFKIHPLIEFLNITCAENAAEHDFHHTHNSGNFGSGPMDWLCGTMDAWAVAGQEEGYLEAKSEEKLSYMHS